jgi:cation diffusion facilitator CzcD-associated flavoprotein CzcO
MEHFDVIIVGAGISGVSAAVHLKQACPDKTFSIIERRESVGGTWDLFKYPGIRSDSDMHTLGFDFKPWKESKSIADGPSILKYVKETTLEYELDKEVKFSHKLVSAKWTSHDAQWTLDVQSEGSTLNISCNFLFMCSGYYSHDEAHDPLIEGVEDFEGPVVKPQFWPEGLQHKGKRVIVVGSGATAMTLVPNMANDGAQVTMLQRSPTYVVARPDQDPIANFLRKVLPEKWAYNLTRLKNIEMQRYFYYQTRTSPRKVRKQLIDMVKQLLPADYDTQTHFTPTYDPWDQRLCLVPNSDLFEAIKSGNAAVVTAEIDRITERGIRLKNGDELVADIIVLATGLKLEVLAGVPFSVDGERVDFAKKFTYKGMMYSGVPNLANTFGYVNASWTLRADLTSEWVCRLLEHMRDSGASKVTPRLREQDQGMQTLPWIADFPAGYMQRVMHLFPQQGEGPWKNTQNFALDKKMIRKAPVADSALVFSANGKSNSADPRQSEIDLQRQRSAG